MRVPIPAPAIPAEAVEHLKAALAIILAEPDLVSRAAWSNRAALRFTDLRDEALAEAMETVEFQRVGPVILAERAQVSKACVVAARSNVDRRMNPNRVASRG